MNSPNIKTNALNKSKINVKLITITAMFAALITITTAFIKIPSPLGYSHAGDSVIYLAASILPGPYGIIAASVGGALADIISGYAHWALPTAIIKALKAVPFVICGIILKKYKKDDKIILTQSAYAHSDYYCNRQRLFYCKRSNVHLAGSSGRAYNLVASAGRRSAYIYCTRRGT